ASSSILEGESGFFQAYARTSMASPIVLFPEGDAEILSVFNKPVPACNFAQSPCQAALEAARRIGGDSRRIAAVRIDTTLAAVRYPGCAAKGPFRYALQAKMSIPFGVAATLARGAIEEGNYSNLDDGEIARLMSGTTLASDGQYTAAFPARQGARVTLSLDDGTSVVSEMDDVVAADSELIHRRFRQAAGAVVGAQRAMEIEDIVDRLDTEPDAGVLAMLCAA
ncbi:MAG: MmgE/PrpD family protein, partial [Pollutimonas bauzanensis]